MYFADDCYNLINFSRVTMSTRSLFGPPEIMKLQVINIAWHTQAFAWLKAERVTVMLSNVKK